MKCLTCGVKMKITIDKTYKCPCCSNILTENKDKRWK